MFIIKSNHSVSDKKKIYRTIHKNFLQKAKPACKPPFSLYLFLCKVLNRNRVFWIILWQVTVFSDLDEYFTPEIEVFLPDYPILEALHYLFSWWEDCLID